MANRSTSSYGKKASFSARPVSVISTFNTPGFCNDPKAMIMAKIIMMIANKKLVVISAQTIAANPKIIAIAYQSRPRLYSGYCVVAQDIIVGPFCVGISLFENYKFKSKRNQWLCLLYTTFALFSNYFILVVLLV